MAEEWLEGCEKEIAPKTLMGYERLVRFHLEPYFGKTALMIGGLRWGEAAALRRSSCNLLRNRIEVKRPCQR